MIVYYHMNVFQMQRKRQLAKTSLGKGKEYDTIVFTGWYSADDQLFYLALFFT